MVGSEFYCLNVVGVCIYCQVDFVILVFVVGVMFVC